VKLLETLSIWLEQKTTGKFGMIFAKKETLGHWVREFGWLGGGQVKL